MPETAALDLYEPLDELKPFGEDIWIVDGPCIEMRYLGFRLPFTTRMTVIRLPDGLWIHSPIRLSRAVEQRIDALGTVRWIVAPNSFHWSYAADWQDRFPAAELWAVPDLDDDKLHADKVIGADMPQWPGLHHLMVRGDVIAEAVFFHESSKTLILTDLIENFELCKVRRPGIRFLYRLAGIVAPDGQMPRDMRLTFLRHRKALRTAVRQMIAWAPERIILAHGRPFREDGTTELRRAFRWLLGRGDQAAR